MRSISPGDADLTSRARIRNAALQLFAELGTKGTTIRGVAELAKVSPALVQHHFGSKEGLRQACDDYVMEYARGEVATAVDEGGLGDPGFIAATYRSSAPVMRYVARALVDGTPAAMAMFDRIVEMTEQYLKAHSEKPAVDFRAQAAVFTAMKLGVTVLHEHVSRSIGVDMLTPEGVARVGAASLDVISAEFVGTDIADLARAGMDRYRRENPSDSREGTTSREGTMEEEK